MAWIVLFDIPSIKQYVFGSDALVEIRGASALLDRLNRRDMEQVLSDALGEKWLRTVYANGGFAQFVVTGGSEQSVQQACQRVVSHLVAETAGGVWPIFGIAPYEGQSYRDALARAFLDLRLRREMAWDRPTVPHWPLLAECESLGHLPAEKPVTWGGETLLLSRCSERKRHQGRRATEHGLWREWMRHLEQTGAWPVRERWDDLRCEDLEEIGARSGYRGYIGLVYADGNAMGKLVRQLSSESMASEFSNIVDQSLREACFAALDHACRPEIERIREAAERNEDQLTTLPADILLLGGDDLLVVLAADRALEFAEHVARQFSERTAERIRTLQDPKARQLFSDYTQGHGLSIACGVAVARAKYPFFLLLELAESLLRSAKRQGDAVARDSGRTVPEPHVDFQVVAGGHCVGVDELRADDYGVGGTVVRTLRPYSVSHLSRLREAVKTLKRAPLPRSKLEAFYRAALEPNVATSERTLRELFARCRFAANERKERDERRALWQACRSLCPEDAQFAFPWYQRGEVRYCAITDMVEAFDLFA